MTSQNTQPAGGEMVLTAADVATRICRDVAELPDRNSPEGWPDAMLVTSAELNSIVLDVIADWTDISLSRQASAQSAAPVELKDGEIAKVVNRLWGIAVTFHDSQQLRERIADVVVPLLKATPPASVPAGDVSNIEVERLLKEAHDIAYDVPGAHRVCVAIGKARKLLATSSKAESGDAKGD